ncbi:hypothetical protein SORDD16_00001 [Streptococcus oralis]|uniref:Uncharacterized protein n=1 Tax=Streptococcus oralis TaxID=1303 RepID=A0A139PGN2_STROR|nr:hypothetical protein SORDD16_00001 [Streptococcus oralis]
MANQNTFPFIYGKMMITYKIPFVTNLFNAILLEDLMSFEFLL